MRHKLSIEEVDNGYIVRHLRVAETTRENLLKQSYDDMGPRVRVYSSFEELVAHLSFLKPTEEQKQRLGWRGHDLR